jgi:hypothetical protein
MDNSHSGNGNGGEPPASDPIPEFAQDVNDSEVELGFSRLVVPSLQGPDGFAALKGVGVSRPVVALILSSFEILVKINGFDGWVRRTKYSHREFGFFSKAETPQDAEWYPIGNPMDDAAVYLQEWKSGLAQKGQPAEVFTRLPFKHYPV